MKKLGLLLSVLVLVSCAPQPTPKIVAVTVPVEVTVLVTQPPKVVEATVLVTQPPLPTYTPYPTHTPYPTLIPTREPSPTLLSSRREMLAFQREILESFEPIGELFDEMEEWDVETSADPFEDYTALYNRSLDLIKDFCTIRRPRGAREVHNALCRGLNLYVEADSILLEYYSTWEDQAYTRYLERFHEADLAWSRAWDSFGDLMTEYDISDIPNPPTPTETPRPTETTRPTATPRPTKNSSPDVSRRDELLDAVTAAREAARNIAWDMDKCVTLRREDCGDFEMVILRYEELLAAPTFTVGPDLQYAYRLYREAVDGILAEGDDMYNCIKNDCPIVPFIAWAPVRTAIEEAERKFNDAIVVLGGTP